MQSDTMEFHTLVSTVQRASRGRSHTSSGGYDSMLRDCDLPDTDLYQAAHRSSRKKTFVILDIATSDRQIVPDFSPAKAAPLTFPVCRFSVA